MKDMDWHNMRTRLEALYNLDNALTGSSEEGLRLVQKKEIDSNLNYVVDNGAGDSLSVVFTETIVLVKGFAHENSLNQFAADEWNQSIIDGMYEGIDEKWMNLFSASEREKTTFFLWYDGEVHQNQKDGNDGGCWLLGYVFDTYERFREFVTEYYSMEFDNDLLKKLYTNSALSDLELAELTAGATKNGCNNFY